jgi:hypothetical protein
MAVGGSQAGCRFVCESVRSSLIRSASASREALTARSFLM